MNRKKLLNLLIILSVTTSLFAQECKSINLAINNNGLTFGNASKTNGIRFSIYDHCLEKVNGFNLTFWHDYNKAKEFSQINGLTIGIIQTSASKINGVAIAPGVHASKLTGVSIGILGTGSEGDIKGISIGGLGTGAGGDVKGVLIGGLGTGCGGNIKGIAIGGIGAGCGGNIKGIGVGGIGIGCGGDVKGFAAGLIGVGSGDDIKGIAIGGVGAGAGGNIKGIAIGGIGLGCGRNFKGFGFGGLNFKAENSIKGIAISAGRIQTNSFTGASICSYTKVGNYKGFSVGILNIAKELNGVQLGLINYAGNNKGILKVLPIINIH